MKPEASSEDGRAERVAVLGCWMDMEHYILGVGPFSRLVLQEIKNKPPSCLSLNCLSFLLRAAANLILIDTSLKKLI